MLCDAHAMLWYANANANAMLCYVMLCYAMLCYVNAMLCYVNVNHTTFPADLIAHYIALTALMLIMLALR